MTTQEYRKSVKAKIAFCRRELKRFLPREMRESYESWLRTAEAELATLPQGRKGFAANVHGRHVSAQGICA